MQVTVGSRCVTDLAGYRYPVHGSSNQEVTVTYLDGPPPARQDIYLDCYQGYSDGDVVEAAATLASAIDHWLCGPFDDGDEGQEYILTRAVERAARFIVAQPCKCDLPDGDLCARCLAIGCGWADHRTECVPQ